MRTVLALAVLLALGPAQGWADGMKQDQVEVCVGLLLLTPKIEQAAVAIGAAAVPSQLQDDMGPDMGALSLDLGSQAHLRKQSIVTAEYFRTMAQEARAELMRAAGCPSNETTPARVAAAVRLAQPELRAVATYRRTSARRCADIGDALRALEQRAYQFAVAATASQLQVYNAAHGGRLHWAEIDELVRWLESTSPWSFDAPAMQAPLRDARLQMSIMVGCRLPDMGKAPAVAP